MRFTFGTYGSYCHYWWWCWWWILVAPKCTSLRVAGEWDTEHDFFRVLAKFCFQKTDVRDELSSGYIYGNITGHPNNVSVLLLLLEQRDYQRVHEKWMTEDADHVCRSLVDESGENCEIGIKNVGNGENNIANDSVAKKCCWPAVKFVHRVPCDEDKLCDMHYEQHTFQPATHAQFTYEIRDTTGPRFWYAALISCYQNETTCVWHHYKKKLTINYDLYFVNGDPSRSSFVPFSYHFSFDKFDTLEFYLLFFVIYTFLLPTQIYAMTHQKHPVTKLFTACLSIQYLGICFILLSLFMFALNGEGFPRLSSFGDFFLMVSRTMLMLLLLLLAKGWALTRIQLIWKPSVCLIWTLFGFIHILLCWWNEENKYFVMEEFEETSELERWSGWILLGMRVSVMTWFVCELKNTMRYEYNVKKIDLFLHFGASALVWLVYLPLATFIALFVSPLWRHKFLLGTTSAADCLAYCVMIHLLWPMRSEQYFLLANAVDTASDELDVFNEAPHNLNSYVSPVSTPQQRHHSQQMKNLIDFNHYS